jgi:quercetin dioxygenase-like cupin family protein
MRTIGQMLSLAIGKLLFRRFTKTTGCAILGRKCLPAPFANPPTKEALLTTYFHSSADRARKPLLPGIVTRTFWGEKMLLSLVDLDAQAAIPLHSHPHEQVGMALLGELDLTIAGETRHVIPGDIYIVPGGVEHGLTVGDAPAQVIEAFSPVREEYKY